MVKIIFFDLDGTLISYRNGKVPASTVKAFQKLRENHILLYACTGRHITELNDLDLSDLKFDGYITLNGQYCYNGEGVYYKNPVNRQDVSHILDYVEEHPFPLMLVEDTQMYINFNNAYVQQTQDHIHTPLPLTGDIHRGYKHPIYQVISYDLSAQQLEDIQHLMPHTKCTMWYPKVIDIIPDHGGKQVGIQKTLDYYHINIEETMAFGDGHNDMTMIQYVHYGIAMGNAIDELKEVAYDVTDDIDEDGLYHALVKYHLI